MEIVRWNQTNRREIHSIETSLYLEFFLDHLCFCNPTNTTRFQLLGDPEKLMIRIGCGKYEPWQNVQRGANKRMKQTIPWKLNFFIDTINALRIHKPNSPPALSASG